jgi:hypothetical protein
MKDKNIDKLKGYSEKIRYNAKKQMAFAGYVLYIWNPNKLECKLLPLTEIKPTCRINSTAETFQLGKPAMFIDGKPLFVLIRDIPYSIELELLTDKTREYIKEKGYSASEIDAKINSVYTNRIFRSKRLNKTDFIIFGLAILTTILTTSMFFMVGGS